MSGQEGSTGADQRRPTEWSKRSERIRVRIGELEVRISELRARRGILGGHVDSAVTSSALLSQARGREQEARVRLRESLHGVVDALRLSAQAHERAAVAHEQLADRGIGAVDEHRRHATEHRAAALLDQVTADAAETSGASNRPGA